MCLIAKIYKHLLKIYPRWLSFCFKNRNTQLKQATEWIKIGNKAWKKQVEHIGFSYYGVKVDLKIAIDLKTISCLNILRLITGTNIGCNWNRASPFQFRLPKLQFKSLVLSFFFQVLTSKKHCRTSIFMAFSRIAWSLHKYPSILGAFLSLDTFNLYLHHFSLTALLKLDSCNRSFSLPISITP